VARLPDTTGDDEELETERGQFELARLRYELYSARKRGDYWYERCRKLENAVRDASEDSSPLLVNLARKVPRHPRKTLTEIRKGRKHG
jgi:hypothetical protein